jgi:hypothetical protein
MRTKTRIVFLGLAASLAALLGVPTPAEGGGLTDGLAVAVSADGSRLVAGGSNRALYELDPATLEVKRRVWLGRRIMHMLFSPDGKVLVVESTTAVQWLKADTLEPFATKKDARGIQPVPALGAVAMLIPDYTKPAIRVFDFADAAEKAAVIYDPRQGLYAFGVSEDGKRLAILHKQQRDETEEKITGQKIPEALRKGGGAALADFEQRHNGYGALFHVFDLASGAQQLEKQLWYSSQDSDSLLTWRGADAYVIAHQAPCAKIDAAGEVSVFVAPHGDNDAYHASTDGKALWAGGYRGGARIQLPELSSVTFQLEKLEGFNETFKDFTTAADGTAFAGTTAFRVLRIGADGKVQKTAPVY